MRHDILSNIKTFNRNYRQAPSDLSDVIYRYRHDNLIAERQYDTNYAKRYAIGKIIERKFGHIMYCSMWQMNRLQFNYHEEMNTHKNILEFVDWYILKFGHIAPEFEISTKKFIIRY